MVVASLSLRHLRLHLRIRLAPIGSAVAQDSSPHIRIKPVLIQVFLLGRRLPVLRHGPVIGRFASRLEQLELRRPPAPLALRACVGSSPQPARSPRRLPPNPRSSTPCSWARHAAPRSTVGSSFEKNPSVGGSLRCAVHPISWKTWLYRWQCSLEQRLSGSPPSRRPSMCGSPACHAAFGERAH